jgi:hypothetical protein
VAGAHRFPPPLLARGLLAIAILSLACGAFVFAGGGGRLQFAGLTASVRSPWPLLLVAAACFALLAATRGRSLRADLSDVTERLSQAAAPLAAALSLFVLLSSTQFGSPVAAGADSSGYISQAQRWREGRLAVPIPEIAVAPWPDAAQTFSPLGYRPGVRPGEIVPTYPPGLPLQLAVAAAAGGPRAAALVVPLLAALGVWLVFAAGRRLAGDTPGLVAAVLFASSPAWLFQAMQPMSDVPVTTWWLLALYLLASPGRARLPLAGLACGVALLTRPNLVPLLLAVVPMAWRTDGDSAAATTSGARLARSLWFAAGLLPVLALLAWMNTSLYGAPLRSGYGTARELFALSNVLPNAVTYGRWLAETHAPALLLALAGVLAVVRTPGQPRRGVCLLVAFAALAVGCYLPYATFETWTYLRFLLPALAVAALFAGAGAVRLITLLPPARRAIALAVLVPAVAGHAVETARQRGAFDLRARDGRYDLAARWIAGHTAPGTFVLAAEHSGSVFHTGERRVVRWDLLDAGCAPSGVGSAEPQPSAPSPSATATTCGASAPWLDLAWTGRWTAGAPPALLVLDAEEEPAFRARFAAASALGRLDWPPAAQTDPPRTVRVYRLEDRDDYLAGRTVVPQRIAAAAR